MEFNSAFKGLKVKYAILKMDKIILSLGMTQTNSYTSLLCYETNKQVH